MLATCHFGPESHLIAASDQPSIYAQVVIYQILPYLIVSSQSKNLGDFLQNPFAESSRIVTGPSFTSSTCIVS
jgi:hypothetical protein